MAGRVKLACERSDGAEALREHLTYVLLSLSTIQLMVSHAHIGEQKAIAFCEAVNCEQSEQVGKFLFLLI